MVVKHGLHYFESCVMRALRKVYEWECLMWDVKEGDTLLNYQLL